MLFLPGSEKHPDIAELLDDMSNLFLSNKSQLYLKEKVSHSQLHLFRQTSIKKFTTIYLRKLVACSLRPEASCNEAPRQEGSRTKNRWF